MPELPHRAATEPAPARTAPTPAYRGLFLEPRFPEHLTDDDIEDQD